MKKKKLKLKKQWRYISCFVMIFIVFFSISKTYSRYKNVADISVEQAIPIYNIETATSKTIEFKDRGWITYNFDVVNGMTNSSNLWVTNQVEMTYTIKPVITEANLPLNIHGLYILDDNGKIVDDIPDGIPTDKYTIDYDNHPVYIYDETDGFGPFILPYDVTGNDYGTRRHYMLVYKWGNCIIGSTDCNDDNNVNYAGKAYKFDIQITAYQKTD